MSFPNNRQLNVLKHHNTVFDEVDYLTCQQWKWQDLLAQIVWITPDISENFIPQMLNVDKLGGISFNKGCYTGQEIVARTHYLGQVKRELYVARCLADKAPAINSIVMSENNAIGTVIAAIQHETDVYVQCVLQTQDITDDLTLKNDAQNKLILVSKNNE